MQQQSYPKNPQQAAQRIPQPRRELPAHWQQPDRDTTHGHPGLPPKDYKAPRERR